MESELILKIVLALVGGGGFFLAIRHIAIALINKNKDKKLRFKNARGEVITQGDITPNEARLIKEFFGMMPVNPSTSNKKLPKPKDD
ncbi:MAG TPA: hypothetical protein VK892_08745 [Pyrinomonadaceae bacterium]|nr:hypothetical protein [Pyrinomonadaceae bacterium]